MSCNKDCPTIVSPGTVLSEGCSTEEINTPTCEETSSECSSPAEIPPCLENHCLETLVYQYSAGVKGTNSWTIPACDQLAIIVVPDLIDIAIGSYLWSSVYGYYEVVAFNKNNQQLTVRNNCQTVNAAPGTQVPACTLFTVSDPPCTPITCTDHTCYLAEDFIAPAVDACVTISVTDSSNLYEGQKISIGGVYYVLNDIVSLTSITICNTGGTGFAPGVTIVALNALGQYVYILRTMFPNLSASQYLSSASVITLNTGNPTTSLTTNLSFTNLSPVYSIDVLYTADFSFSGRAVKANTQNCSVLSSLQESIDGGPFANLILFPQSYYYVNDTGCKQSKAGSYTGKLTVLPGATRTVSHKHQLSWTGDAVASFVIDNGMTFLEFIKLSSVGMGIKVY